MYSIFSADTSYQYIYTLLFDNSVFNIVITQWCKNNYQVIALKDLLSSFSLSVPWSRG